MSAMLRLALLLLCLEWLSAPTAAINGLPVVVNRLCARDCTLSVTVALSPATEVPNAFALDGTAATGRLA